MPTIIRKKTQNISVSLPKDLTEKIGSYSTKKGITVSQFIKEAAKSYFVEQELIDIQKTVGPAFRRRGIETDDDVEKFLG